MFYAFRWPARFLLLSSAWEVVHTAGSKTLSRLQRQGGVPGRVRHQASGAPHRASAATVHTRMGRSSAMPCSTHAEYTGGNSLSDGPQSDGDGECAVSRSWWRPASAPPWGHHLVGLCQGCGEHYGRLPMGVVSLGLVRHWRDQNAT